MTADTTKAMIGAVENAMLARIAAYLPHLGYTLKTLATWAGDINDLNTAIKDVPAIWVFFSGGRKLDRTNTGTKWEMHFKLLVATTNRRNERAARHGAAGEPGTYQLAMDAIAILQNSKLGLPIEPVNVDNWKPLTQESAKNGLSSIHGVELSTIMQIGNMPAIDVADFQTLHANWDVPAFKLVGGNVPNDPKAAATDDIAIVITAGDFNDDFETGDFSDAPADMNPADFAGKDFANAPKPKDFNPNDFNPDDYEE